MWTPTTRQQHSRIVTRYQTDLTDADPVNCPKFRLMPPGFTPHFDVDKGPVHLRR